MARRHDHEIACAHRIDHSVRPNGRPHRYARVRESRTFKTRGIRLRTRLAHAIDVEPYYRLRYTPQRLDQQVNAFIRLEAAEIAESQRALFNARCTGRRRSTKNRTAHGLPTNCELRIGHSVHAENVRDPSADGDDTVNHLQKSSEAVMVRPYEGRHAQRREGSASESDTLERIA
jgi:hypothetical protein